MEHETQASSERRKWLEIVAVALTGLGKPIFMDFLDWRFFYIATACLGWAAYILYRSKSSPGILQYWGFRRDNFKEVFMLLLPYVLLASLVFVLLGHWRGSLNLSWHILPIMLIYPIWGVIQHFLILALFGGNLQEQMRYPIPKWLIVILTAFLFAIVHYPFPLLIAGTFVLALVYVLVYLKSRNLWVLGMYHGFLGAVFFYSIMERDPWLEIFGALGLA
ncbi:MAG: CPBP family intramembrane glutamic endopeptidase [Bacteroidia bacterium]|nr:CPBP family intramembrane glutamic endopeptidase [Bacteroidia bacterium]